jgi:hypothetical protein
MPVRHGRIHQIDAGNQRYPVIRTIRTVLALSLALTYAACRPKESGPAAPSEASSPKASGPASSDASAPPPAKTEPAEDRFQIGKTAAEDGKVLSDSDQFTAGDPIYISFVVRNAPAGAQARVTWKRIDGDVKMGEEQKPLGPGGFVSFSVKSTSSWRPGKYRVEKWLAQEASGSPPSPRWLGIKDLTISPR